MHLHSGRETVPHPGIFLGTKEARGSLEGKPHGQGEQEGPEARTEAEGQDGPGLGAHTAAFTSSSSFPDLAWSLTFGQGKGKSLH